MTDAKHMEPNGGKNAAEPAKEEMPKPTATILSHPLQTPPPPPPPPQSPSPTLTRVLRRRHSSTPIAMKNDSESENDEEEVTLIENDNRNMTISEPGNNDSAPGIVNNPKNIGGKSTGGTKTPVEKMCTECKFMVVYNIKCHHCAKLLCFSCTMLPRENFLYYFLTASQYRCTECCVNDLITKRNIKNLDTHGDKLEEEIEKMKTCSRASESAVNPNTPEPSQSQDAAVPTPLPTHSHPHIHASATHLTLPSNSQTPPSFPPPPIPPMGPKPKCKFFMRGYCKKSREECNFEHPKLCRNYMRGRDNPKNGCRKGSSCGFEHPSVCYQLEDYGFCQKNENGPCRYFHRKNAMRTEGIFDQHFWEPNGQQIENRPLRTSVRAPPSPNEQNDEYLNEFPQMNEPRPSRRQFQRHPPHPQHPARPQPATDFLNRMNVPPYVLWDFIAEAKQREAFTPRNR